MLTFLTFQTQAPPAEGFPNALSLSLALCGLCWPLPSICARVSSHCCCACGAKCERIAKKRGAQGSASLPQMNFLCNISFPTICIQYIHTRTCSDGPTALLCFLSRIPTLCCSLYYAHVCLCHENTVERIAIKMLRKYLTSNHRTIPT